MKPPKILAVASAIDLDFRVYEFSPSAIYEICPFFHHRNIFFVD